MTEKQYRKEYVKELYNRYYGPNSIDEQEENNSALPIRKRRTKRDKLATTVKPVKPVKPEIVIKQKAVKESKNQLDKAAITRKDKKESISAPVKSGKRGRPKGSKNMGRRLF